MKFNYSSTMNCTNIDFSTQLMCSFGTVGIVWWAIGLIVGVVLSMLVFVCILSKKDRRIKELIDKNTQLERLIHQNTWDAEEPEVVYVVMPRREPTASLVIATAIPLEIVSG